MSTTDTNTLQRLPEELRASIFSYCDSSTILNLCLGSRSMYHLCIPSLFYAIDLSVHNREQWGIHDKYVNIDVPADHLMRAKTERDRRMLWRQRRLIALLETKPELVRQTRVLRWTMMESESIITPFSSGTDGLWKAFACFTKVTEIDIGYMTGWRELDIPPPLFATATSVSLTGLASIWTIGSILNSIDPANLRHLAFNNLQIFKETDENLNQVFTDVQIDAYRSDHPGATYGWLTYLTDQCTSLRSFHFTTTAEFVDHSREFHVPSHWGREVQDDHRRYAELGAFIASVKPTLRDLVFEHGPDMDYYGTTLGRHTIRAFEGPDHDDPLPMDVYFDTHVFPVLASGPWPKLKRMVIRGIGHWKPIHPWDEAAKPGEISYLHNKTRAFHDRAELIWDAVGGDRVDVVIEDVASRPFYRFQADKQMSVTGVIPSPASTEF